MEFDGRRVTNHLEVSHDLERYINKSEMFVEYDTDIYADSSILNIPLVATILPLAWLTGSDVYVDTLDKGFHSSMNHLRDVFKTMLPLPSYDTEIHVKQLVENNIDPMDYERRTGLLFSGGIDSFYSLASNIEEKPSLVMHWGVEGPPYPVYKEYWENVNKTYREYAAKNDLNFNLTKTNVLDVVFSRKIEHAFHRELYYGSLWVRLQESLVLLCLAAPLSMKRFDKLLIAASMSPGSPSNSDINRPHSARAEIDEVISWAGLSVRHDGFIQRYRKTRYLSDFMKDNKIQLRVCLARPGNQNKSDKLNCNNCSKCYRTIMQLSQAGSNPDDCGFELDDTTFKKIRDHYEANGLDIYAKNSKEIIPEIIEHDFYGSREFFEWLRVFTPGEPVNLWPYRDLYFSLPYPAAKLLDKIYQKLDVRIHDGNPVLPPSILERLKP